MKKNFLDELLTLLASTGITPEQYMIEHSLFFSKDAVDKAFDEMGKKLNAGDPLFIRSSTKQGSNSPYRDVNGTYYWNNIYRLRSLDNIEVKLDADGNSEVRNIIKTLTGTSVSVGKKSDIKFGKISHIWGETSNPFFFTSLWNIVIVPAYYNDILDKDGSADPRIDMIIEQYKAVCWDRYDIQAKLLKLGLTPTEIKKYEPKHKVAYSYIIQEITILQPKNGISGPSIPGVKVGEIANNDLRIVLSSSSKVTNKDISDLQDKIISKALFGINFPVLDVAPADKKRYYAKPVTIKGKDYFLCSQWYDRHRQALEDWINTHK